MTSASPDVPGFHGSNKKAGTRTHARVGNHGHSWRRRAAAISARHHPPSRIPSSCSRPRACVRGRRTGPPHPGACVQVPSRARSYAAVPHRRPRPGLRCPDSTGRHPAGKRGGEGGGGRAARLPRWKGLWRVQLDLEGALVFVPGRGFRTCGLRAPPSYGNTTSSGNLAQARKTSHPFFLFPYTDDQNALVSPSNVDSHIRSVSGSRQRVLRSETTRD